MPPPQPLFASRIRGFVCRSCSLKLQIPRRQTTPWLSRNVTNDRGPTGTKRTKGAKSKVSHSQPMEQTEPIIRYFEEAPDGKRTEIHNDPEEEAFMKNLESTMREMEKGKGGSRNSLEDEEEDRELDLDLMELQNEFLNDGMGDVKEEFIKSLDSVMVDLKTKMEGSAEDINSQQDEIPDTLANSDMVKALSSKMEELQAQMQRLGSAETKSPEERSRIAEEVLKLDLDIEPRLLIPPSARSAKTSLPLNHSTRSPIEPGITIPVEAFPGSEKNITALNIALRRALITLTKGHLDSQISKQTWKSYALCRKALLSKLHMVPQEVWSVLWSVSTHKDLLNMEHLAMLGRDMRNAGVPLRGKERLFYIEATFIQGPRATAIEMWERAENPLGRDMNTFKDYWELGVRMYCQIGQPDRALRAAEVLLKLSDPVTTFRIFIPIIQAFVSSNDKRRAWGFYIRLKLALGHQMTMEDYDAIASIFLTADLPDLALGVFKDMMLTVDSSTEQHGSIAQYKTATGIKIDLDLMRISEKELTWEDSRSLARLPPHFNNKFFFGKWLKKLIGAGELDAAAKVVNLMHQRGIRPDAKHINGLIGARLRAESAPNQKLAEEMAWRMIKERLAFVESRDAFAGLEGPVRAVRMPSKLDHKTLFLFPGATTETFSLLMEHYRRRQRHDLMRDLFTTLEKAKVPPDTFFMNQLLMVDSQSQRYWAWDTYTSLVRQYEVHPDFDTFEYLWHLAKRAVDPIRNPMISTTLAKDIQNDIFPRFLFAEMVGKAPILTKREKLPRQLYDSIILCFSLANDQPGTAVALRALQRHFNMFPNEDTVRTIVLQLARLGLKNEAGRRPRRLKLKSSAHVKERVTQVTKILEAFKNERVEALRTQGIVFEELEGDARLEESLMLLSDLLQYVCQTRLKEEEAVESVTEVSKLAAVAMGVPDCVAW